MSSSILNTGFATPLRSAVASFRDECIPSSVVRPQSVPPLATPRKGQLVAANLLSNRIVVVGGAGVPALDRVSNWIETMGGVPRDVAGSALQATVRRYAPRLAAIVLFEPSDSEARGPAFHLLRDAVPKVAMIRISETKGNSDFDGRRPGPFDATIHGRLSEVRFALGVSAALSNAARRCCL